MVQFLSHVQTCCKVLKLGKMLAYSTDCLLSSTEVCWYTLPVLIYYQALLSRFVIVLLTSGLQKSLALLKSATKQQKLLLLIRVHWEIWGLLIICASCNYDVLAQKSFSLSLLKFLNRISNRTSVIWIATTTKHSTRELLAHQVSKVQNPLTQSQNPLLLGYQTWIPFHAVKWTQQVNPVRKANQLI